MPSKKRHAKKPLVEHFQVGLRVDKYDASVGASINHGVEEPKYAIGDLTDDEPVYDYVTHLTIIGSVVYPPERVGEQYELTIYGNDAPSRKISLKLRDVQARSEYNSPLYREYRGGSIPVVGPIPSFGFVDKNRASGRRTAWLNVAPRLVSDMLTLLAAQRTTFVSLYERKEERTRWIRRVELQTTDPAEE